MELLENIYGDKFFKRRHQLSWRAKHVCRAVQKLYNPKSVIDCGAAVGDLVKGFQDLHIETKGIEGSNKALKYLECPVSSMLFHDLRQPVPDSIGRYDVVVCFEVIEHIKEKYVDTLVANLCALSDRLLLSAAVPGQGGVHHVNCQEPEYWEAHFGLKGYVRNKDIEAQFRLLVYPWRSKYGIRAYYNNVLCFDKENE